MSTQKPKTIYEERDQLYATLSRYETALEKRLNEIRRLEGVNADLLAALKEAKKWAEDDLTLVEPEWYEDAADAIEKAEPS